MIESERDSIRIVFAEGPLALPAVPVERVGFIGVREDGVHMIRRRELSAIDSVDPGHHGKRRRLSRVRCAGGPPRHVDRTDVERHEGSAQPGLDDGPCSVALDLKHSASPLRERAESATG